MLADWFYAEFKAKKIDDIWFQYDGAKCYNHYSASNYQKLNNAHKLWTPRRYGLFYLVVRKIKIKIGKKKSGPYFSKVALVTFFYVNILSSVRLLNKHFGFDLMVALARTLLTYIKIFDQEVLFYFELLGKSIDFHNIRY